MQIEKSRAELSLMTQNLPIALPEFLLSFEIFLAKKICSVLNS